MIPVLNACGIHCAVYGNHDFGEWHFTYYSKDLVSRLQPLMEQLGTQ